MRTSPPTNSLQPMPIGVFRSALAVDIIRPAWLSFICQTSSPHKLRLIAQKFLSKFLFMFWFAVTSPPILLLIWLCHSYPQFESATSWIGVPLMLVWIFGSFWLAITTVHHMVNEHRMFLAAVNQTYHARSRAQTGVCAIDRLLVCT